jgi:hypothetical protein
VPEVSKRAKQLWQRLIEWYGTRIVEQYGAAPPADWCCIVDELDNTAVKRGLSIIRARHIQHPPTLPEFDQAMRPKQDSAPQGPNPAERLCAYVLKTYRSNLTAKQIRVPWTYLGNGEGITGVVVPADGDRPGYRVMLADIGHPPDPDWFDAQRNYLEPP